MGTQQRPDELGAMREWYRYNSFVRKRYLAALERLPPEELRRDRGASYPTLLDILEHTMGAYFHWLFAGYGLKSPFSAEEEQREVESVQDLREAEAKIDSAVLAFVEGLAASDLDKTVEEPGRDPTDKRRFTLRQVLWHLVEEELQHRGELNALLWQMDADPPITDWLDWKTELGEVAGPAEEASK